MYPVSPGWFVRFMGRHQELSLRAGGKVSRARASSSTKACMDNYFDKTMDEFNLSKFPALIYNMDESGFPLDPAPQKTVQGRGVKLHCIRGIEGTGFSGSLRECIWPVSPPIYYMERNREKVQY